MTWRTPARSTRSARSADPRTVEVGRITAPAFMIASIVSHSSTRLPSMSITWSPFRTPSPTSHVATRSERVAISSNVTWRSDPSPATTRSATRSFPRAIWSNQSTAQLQESPTSGHSNRATAAVRSVRISWRRSRAAR